MTATVLDGKAYAKQMEAELAEQVAKIKTRLWTHADFGNDFGGDDPASATYVKMKGQCLSTCRYGFVEKLPCQYKPPLSNISKIAELNNNPDVHGILLQHPVPSQIDEACLF